MSITGAALLISVLAFGLSLYTFATAQLANRHAFLIVRLERHRSPQRPGSILVIHNAGPGVARELAA